MVSLCHFITQYIRQTGSNGLWKIEEVVSIFDCNSKVEEVEKII